MELGLIIETLEKELKSEDQRFSISNTRKADLLFIIKREIEKFEGDMSKYSNSLENILITVTSQGCTSPLRRLTKKTLKSYLEKLKQSKILSLLFEFLKIVQSIKSTPLAKASSFDIIGFIYLNFNLKLTSPPTEDILEAAKKYYKSSDTSMKKIIVKALSSIIESRPSNLNPLAPEYLKFLLKTAFVRPI
jgi:hypothetical protein